MYKVFNGKTWETFNSYTELVNWLSKFNSWGDGNTFLNRVGNNSNDTYRKSEWVPHQITANSREFVVGHTEANYLARDCRIVDKDGNSIYNKVLEEAVRKHVYDDKLEMKRVREKRKGKKQRYYGGWRWGIPESAYPDFRQGPWPYIHARHRYNMYRHIKTMNEKRLSSDKDYKEFNRASRGNNLPDLWDDQIRDWRNTGWKNQGKKKRQWENGVITKTKHKHGNIYVEKNCNKREYEIDDYIDAFDNEESKD